VNGELAQVLVLASHGTRFLASGGEAPRLASNSAFVGCGPVRFEAGGAPPAPARPDAVRDEPGDPVARWLSSLATGGVRRLAAVAGTDPQTRGALTLEAHQSVAFANAGDWALVSEGPTQEVWRPTWRVGTGGGAGRGPVVVYRASRPPRPLEVPATSVAAAAATLAAVLEDAGDFAAEAGLTPWDQVFVLALAARSADEPQTAYFPDLLPTDWPRPSRSLAAMASTAWVFGAMGSWNDLSFADEATRSRYDAVSVDLYRAVLDGLVTAANRGPAPAD